MNSMNLVLMILSIFKIKKLFELINWVKNYLNKLFLIKNQNSLNFQNYKLLSNQIQDFNQVVTGLSNPTV